MTTHGRWCLESAAITSASIRRTSECPMPDEDPDHGMVPIRNQPARRAMRISGQGNRRRRLPRTGPLRNSQTRRSADRGFAAGRRCGAQDRFPGRPLLAPLQPRRLRPARRRRAFLGWGVGTAWPLLTGERGHYELAAGRDSAAYLRAMENFAIANRPVARAGLGSLPTFRDAMLYFGKPTGAAMPLMWAHAEYIKLLRSTADGQVFDLIPEVADRYRERGRARRWRCGSRNRQIEDVPPACACGSRRRSRSCCIGRRTTGRTRARHAIRPATAIGNQLRRYRNPAGRAGADALHLSSGIATGLGRHATTSVNVYAEISAVRRNARAQIQRDRPSDSDQGLGFLLALFRREVKLQLMAERVFGAQRRQVVVGFDDRLEQARSARAVLPAASSPSRVAEAGARHRNSSVGFICIVHFQACHASGVTACSRRRLLQYRMYDGTPRLIFVTGKGGTGKSTAPRPRHWRSPAGGQP